MKALHYNMMRPEFLLGLMGGNVGELTMDSMRKTLEDTTPLCYVTYTVLMEANIERMIELQDKLLRNGTPDAFRMAMRLHLSTQFENMEANIDKADVDHMYNDGESIAVTFRSKKKAKEVKDVCNKEIVRYGSHHYRAKLKVMAEHLICEAERIDEDDDEE